MDKISRDQETVRFMISLFVKHHDLTDEQKAEYDALADYACKRLQYCKYGAKKLACKDCPTHCYAPSKRAMVQDVMRWSGPRMIIYAPRAAFRHIAQCLKAKKHTQK